MRWAGTWPASAAILVAMQAWFLRGIWSVKDLDTGDTASYYSYGMEWAEHLRVNPLWSPAYTIAIGSLHWLLNDAYVELLVMRIGVVLIAGLLLLTVLRSVATAGIALVFALGFAANPVFFDSVYSVHLFAILFPLGALALTRRRDAEAYRVVVIIILVLGGVLSRNEYFVPAALFAAYVVVQEVRKRLRRGNASSVRTPASVWARRAVVGGAILLSGYLLLLPFRSTYSTAEFQVASSAKHTLNVGQIYAFYLTQSEGWQGDPWTGYQEVMQRDFGAPESTLSHALFANPAAIAGFVRWNLDLLPSGIALGLTGQYSGGPDPDYVTQPVGSYGTPAALGIVLLALAGVLAAFFTASGRRTWRLPRAPDTIVLVGSFVLLMVFIALTQRPRPSYLYMLTVAILLFAAWFVSWCLVRWNIARIVSPVAAISAIAICVMLPQHFGADYANVFSGRGRPLLDQYRAARAVISTTDGKPDIVVRSPSPDSSLCSSFLFYDDDACTIEWGPVLQVEVLPHR